MQYKQTEEEREKLTTDIMDQTMERLKECNGGVFNALFNDESKPRKPEYNLKYAAGPSLDLINQYTRLVEDSQTEINGLHGMMSSKKLDKSKLLVDNNKFLAQYANKYSWGKYEEQLANERVTTERLTEMLLKKHNMNTLL